LRKKISASERLAQRPGPKKTAALTVILQSDQPVNPQIAELNGKLSVCSPPRRGAPLGNRNRLTHGRRTKARRAFLAAVRAHVRRGNWLVRQVQALRPVTKSGRRTSYVRYLTGEPT